MADKAKRVVLSPAQRVAKLEADLAAAKAKAEAQQTKAADKLLEKRSALTTKVNDLLNKIEAIDTELATYGVGVTSITERVEQLAEIIDDSIYT